MEGKVRWGEGGERGDAVGRETDCVAAAVVVVVVVVVCVCLDGASTGEWEVGKEGGGT